MNFAKMLIYFAKASPQKPAIILSDRIVTFSMIASGMRSVAVAIKDQGLKKGDLVALKISSPTRHFIVASALYWMGIISVSLAGHEDLTQMGRRIDALIVDTPPSRDFSLRILRVVDDWFARPFDPTYEPEGFDHENDLARIIMSSGTTAIPKPIGHSVRVVEDRIQTGYRTLSMASWDRMMCLPVMTSSLGFGSALQALSYGHTTVFAETAVEALQMISLYGVDLLVANPQHLKAMVEAHIETPIPTPTLRLIKYGGNALVPSLAVEVRQRFCKDVLCVYSSTESGPIAYGHIDHILAHPGSTGLVAPWVSLEILGPDDKKVAAGVEGRLRIRSQWQGYDLRGSQDSANEWMYPGDIASVLTNGILSLVGRVADAVEIEGVFVSPEQIEQAIAELPTINDAAALGMPAPNGKHELWLAICVSGHLNETEIRNFLAKKNPKWVPAQIRKIDKIMRNDMGKIVRSRVREKLTDA